MALVNCDKGCDSPTIANSSATNLGTCIAALTDLGRNLFAGGRLKHIACLVRDFFVCVTLRCGVDLAYGCPDQFSITTIPSIWTKEQFLSVDLPLPNFLSNESRPEKFRESARVIQEMVVANKKQSHSPLSRKSSLGACPCWLFMLSCLDLAERG